MGERLETYTTKAGQVKTVDHGTARGYRRGCRCVECVEAYREEWRAARDRRQARPIPDHVHGTWNGYSNYGCRCSQCLWACQQRYPDSAAYRQANRDDLNAKRRDYYKDTGK